MFTVINRLIGEDIHFDWKMVTITVVSTLLLTVGAYHQITPSGYWDGVILYLGAPLVLIVFVFREHPREYGLSLGDWKAGAVLALLGITLMAPVIYYVGHNNDAMKFYYQHQVRGLPWKCVLDLLGWEFLFRGWVLFGYARKLGSAALWLQAVPFAMAHIGKPELETLFTIFGGFAFGWIAWRTRSFVWPLVIHCFVAVWMILVAAGAIQ